MMMMMVMAICGNAMAKYSDSHSPVSPPSAGWELFLGEITLETKHRHRSLTRFDLCENSRLANIHNRNELHCNQMKLFLQFYNIEVDAMQARTC